MNQCGLKVLNSRVGVHRCKEFETDALDDSQERLSLRGPFTDELYQDFQQQLLRHRRGDLRRLRKPVWFGGSHERDLCVDQGSLLRNIKPGLDENQEKILLFGGPLGHSLGFECSLSNSSDLQTILRMKRQGQRKFVPLISQSTEERNGNLLQVLQFRPGDREIFETFEPSSTEQKLIRDHPEILDLYLMGLHLPTLISEVIPQLSSMTTEEEWNEFYQKVLLIDRLVQGTLPETQPLEAMSPLILQLLLLDDRDSFWKILRQPAVQWTLRTGLSHSLHDFDFLFRHELNLADLTFFSRSDDKLPPLERFVTRVQQELPSFRQQQELVNLIAAASARAREEEDLDERLLLNELLQVIEPPGQIFLEGLHLQPEEMGDWKLETLAAIPDWLRQWNESEGQVVRPDDDDPVQTLILLLDARDDFLENRYQLSTRPPRDRITSQVRQNAYLFFGAPREELDLLFSRE